MISIHVYKSHFDQALN